MATDIRIFRAEDWTTLYADGEKVAENHSIDLNTIAEYVDGMSVEWLPDNVDEAMGYYGEMMPDKLEDVATWGTDLAACRAKDADK
jgi:hypothetical protein